MHAAVCARRQIEIGDQELRSFVVKQSLIQIHCVVAFVLTVIAAKLFGLLGAHGSGAGLSAFTAIASLAIATSAQTIRRAVAHRRNWRRTVRATPAKAGDSLAVDQVIEEFE